MRRPSDQGVRGCYRTTQPWAEKTALEGPLIKAVERNPSAPPLSQSNQSLLGTEIAWDT